MCCTLPGLLSAHTCGLTPSTGRGGRERPSFLPLQIHVSASKCGGPEARGVAPFLSPQGRWFRAPGGGGLCWIGGGFGADNRFGSVPHRPAPEHQGARTGVSVCALICRRTSVRARSRSSLPLMAVHSFLRESQPEEAKPTSTKLVVFFKV